MALALEIAEVAVAKAPLSECTIHFDGGTTNEYPEQGRLWRRLWLLPLNGEVVRVNFARAMSNNEAEVRALIAAAEAVKLISDPARTRLSVVGDSKIALKWAQQAGQQAFYRPKLGWSPGFTLAIADLYLSLKPFAAVGTELATSRAHCANLWPLKRRGTHR